MFKRLVCIYFLMLFSLPAFVLAATDFPTYFTYSEEEMHHLQGGSSTYSMSKGELLKWDAFTAHAIREGRIDFYQRMRIFTYLYVAQREAAFLSHTVKGRFEGSLDPVSYKVLSLFFTNLPKPDLYQEDAYSEALAKVVWKRIEQRVEKEDDSMNEYHVPREHQKAFSAGWNTAKWIPWYAEPAKAFWPPAPPPMSDPSWKVQIQEIKKAQTPMTEEKKQIVYRWAGLAYPWSDDWREIMNHYLFCKAIPFPKTLLVRSTVMMGLYDTILVYGQTKYHYLVIRPQVFDPSIRYYIKVPSHPSYPAGHSAESAVTATLMAYFFPSDASYWQQLAEECSLSRIWAGVHYPIDAEGGKRIGSKVAEKIEETLQK